MSASAVSVGELCRDLERQSRRKGEVVGRVKSSAKVKVRI